MDPSPTNGKRILSVPPELIARASAAKRQRCTSSLSDEQALTELLAKDTLLDRLLDEGRTEVIANFLRAIENKESQYTSVGEFLSLWPWIELPPPNALDELPALAAKAAKLTLALSTDQMHQMASHSAFHNELTTLIILAAHHVRSGEPGAKPSKRQVATHLNHYFLAHPRPLLRFWEVLQNDRWATYDMHDLACEKFVWTDYRMYQDLFASVARGDKPHNPGQRVPSDDTSESE